LQSVGFYLKIGISRQSAFGEMRETAERPKLGWEAATILVRSNSEVRAKPFGGTAPTSRSLMDVAKTLSA